MTVRPWAVVLLLAVVGCAATGGGGRYSMATDPASRYSFRYVRDRTTGLWVQRECEARVSTKRLVDDAHGRVLHSQKFAPESVGSGDLDPSRFEVKDGWRVWRFRMLPGEDDFRGRTALGIQVERPKRGGPSDWEPMELFAYPPMPPMVPDEWSSWSTAASQRAGGFGWWEEVHGEPPTPPVPIAFPFELRCRLLLKDHLYVE